MKIWKFTTIRSPITRPLLQLPKLEKLRVPDGAKKLDPLRQHPTLKFIANGDAPYRPVAEFWKEYDAQQAGSLRHPGEPPAPLPPSSAGKK